MSIKDRIGLAPALLLIAVAAGLASANLARGVVGEAVRGFYEAGDTLRIGPIALDVSLQSAVFNLGIAAFFYLVGLELKRELIDGSLSPIKNLWPPLFAAILGVALPAAWYLLLNPQSPQALGWAIPTATDVTFALAVFVSFGTKLPPAARTFLLAFAVIDDVIAVLVITFMFHGGSGHGLVVPPALVGVLLGLVLPVRSIRRVERKLNIVVSWIVLPLFAFYSAIVALPGYEVATSPVFWGVVARPIWKLAGVFLGGWLGMRFSTAGMRLSKPNLLRVSALGGIGFTVSLLVAQLAFADRPELQAAAILATFVAAAISAIVGAVALASGHRAETANSS
jgi:NhaA family Na+:H+ antiporter